MADTRSVYCGGCGSIVGSSDSFCGVCGTSVSPDEVPTMSFPPPRVPPAPAGSGGRPGGSRHLLALAGGIGAIVAVLLVVGIILTFNLLGSETGSGNTADSGGARLTPQNAGQESSPQDSETPSGTDASGETGDVSSPTTYSVGDTVDVNGIGATLNGVRTLPESDMDPTSASDNLFVAADMTFENTTDSPVAVSSLLELVLKDEGGYSAQQTIHSGQRQLAEGNIAPGQRTSGEVVYEVPSDAESLQLDFTPAFGTETFTWDVGDAEGLSGPAGSASGVTPDSVTASGTSPSAPDASGNTISYEAENAVDGDISTGWNVDGDGIGQSVTLEYEEPVTVSEIGIIPGYDKVDPTDGTYRFYQLYVARSAEIEFSDGSSVTIDFDRDPAMQYVEVPDVETTSVEVTITDSYPPGTSPYGETYPYTLEKAALSEIQVSGP